MITKKDMYDLHYLGLAIAYSGIGTGDKGSRKRVQRISH